MRNRDDGWKAALGKVGPQSHRRLAARCRPSAPSRGWPVSGSWHWVVNDCNWGGSRLAAFSVRRHQRERQELGRLPTVGFAAAQPGNRTSRLESRNVRCRPLLARNASRLSARSRSLAKLASIPCSLSGNSSSGESSPFANEEAIWRRRPRCYFRSCPSPFVRGEKEASRHQTVPTSAPGN